MSATDLLRTANLKRLERGWPPLRVTFNDVTVSVCTSAHDAPKVAAKTIEESAAKFCDLMDREYPL